MTEDKEVKLDGWLAVALIWFCTLLDGWAIHIIWRWFVVPIGVRPIGVFHAMGLDLLLATFRGRGPRKKPAVLSDITWAAARTMTYLGFAWVAHTFMVHW